MFVTRKYGGNKLGVRRFDIVRDISKEAVKSLRDHTSPSSTGSTQPLQQAIPVTPSSPIPNSEPDAISDMIIEASEDTEEDPHEKDDQTHEQSQGTQAAGEEKKNTKEPNSKVKENNIIK